MTFDPWVLQVHLGEERGKEELKNLCKEVSHLGRRPEEAVKLTNRTPLSFPTCPLKREAGWQLRPLNDLYEIHS